MSSFTPGPWHISGNVLDIRDTNEDNIVTVPYSDNTDTDLANARLIAAAPELLLALQAVIADAKAHGYENISYSMAEEAIAKALNS